MCLSGSTQLLQRLKSTFLKKNLAGPFIRKNFKNVDFSLWGKRSALSCWQNGLFFRVLAHCAQARISILCYTATYMELEVERLGSDLWHFFMTQSLASLVVGVNIKGRCIHYSMYVWRIGTHHWENRVYHIDTVGALSLISDQASIAIPSSSFLCHHQRFRAGFMVVKGVG